jgi:hypothetical protein
MKLVVTGGFHVRKGSEPSNFGIFLGELSINCAMYIGSRHNGLLAAGNGPNDEKRLGPRRDRVGQWGIRRLMGQILLAGEEPQERPALLGDLVADRGWR